jgi:hypothetical protein
MHVNPASSCSACAEKLSQCHSTLRLWHEIISDNFPDCHVAVGFRGQVDQEIAFQNHLTHAPFPKSKHNRMNGNIPESWAIDIFQLSEEGVAVFNPLYFTKIWDFINNIQTKAEDIELAWGGNFSNLKDLDHIEMLKAEVTQSIEVLSQDSC